MLHIRLNICLLLTLLHLSNKYLRIFCKLLNRLGSVITRKRVLLAQKVSDRLGVVCKLLLVEGFVCPAIDMYLLLLNG